MMIFKKSNEQNAGEDEVRCLCCEHFQHLVTWLIANPYFELRKSVKCESCQCSPTLEPAIESGNIASIRHRLFKACWFGANREGIGVKNHDAVIPLKFAYYGCDFS